MPPPLPPPGMGCECGAGPAGGYSVQNGGWLAVHLAGALTGWIRGGWQVPWLVPCWGLHDWRCNTLPCSSAQ